jgi:predicted methyltransferase
MTGERIVGDVASVVGLAEGEAGVRDVIRTVSRLEPVAVRAVSRATELPVPFVSAICNELRKRGIVSAHRPVQLTARGRDLFGSNSLRLPLEAACGSCSRRGIVVPPSLEPLARELAAFADAAPPPRLEIDQTHCTVETKIRRVLALYEAGALEDRRILLLGDDDLTSLAISLVVQQLGSRATLRGVAVVDVDPALVDFLRRALVDAPFPVEVVRHDLREPLADTLVGWADTVFTDPPYTSSGASLFLSRAVEATAGRVRADVFLSFGPRKPEETLELQRAIADMGFVVRSLIRNFNDYVGAGSIGATSHLYHLATTADVRPLVGGRYDAPIYTGELRDPGRSYRCKGCGLSKKVGPGRRWSTVHALKQDGCPRCRGTSFAPLPRTRR